MSYEDGEIKSKDLSPQMIEWLKHKRKWDAIQAIMIAGITMAQAVIIVLLGTLRK